MRPLPKFDYHEPASLKEAAALLASSKGEGMIIGGGTDLVPSMRQGLFTPGTVISLQAVSGLDRISWDDDGLHIGPQARLRDLECDAAVARFFPIIAEAAHAVAAPHLRRMATVAGNLCLDTRCWYYNQYEDWQECGDPCLRLGGEVCKAVPRARKCFATFSADLAPALVALGARITLVSARGERTIELADFYSGDGASPHAKEGDEIVSGVLVPADMAGCRGAYRKFRVRNAIDYPIAGVAVVFRFEEDTGICHEPRIVLTGVATAPVVVKGAGELLDGKVLDGALIGEAARIARKAGMPVANTTGTREHRRLMIDQLARQAFEAALSGESEA